MSDPGWYRDWRHDAVHELQAKIQRLKDEFHLGTWPRYDYDVDTGTLIFSEAGVAKVVAEIPDHRDNQHEGRKLALGLGQQPLAGRTRHGR